MAELTAIETSEVKVNTNPLVGEFEEAKIMPDNSTAILFSFTEDRRRIMQPKAENTALLVVKRDRNPIAGTKFAPEFYLVKAEPFVSVEEKSGQRKDETTGFMVLKKWIETTATFSLSGIKIEGVSLVQESKGQIDEIQKAIEAGRFQTLPHEVFSITNDGNRFGTVTFHQEGTSGYADELTNGQLRFSKGPNKIPQFKLDVPKREAFYETFSQAEVLQIRVVQK